MVERGRRIGGQWKILAPFWRNRRVCARRGEKGVYNHVAWLLQTVQESVCLFSALEVYFMCMRVVPSYRQVERGPEVKRTINGKGNGKKETRRKNVRKEIPSFLASC